MTEDGTTAVWKALADPTRRQILDLLRVRSRTTGELAAGFPAISRFAVMKHLDVLEQAELVVVRRQGRERWNHLNAVPLQQIAERWIGPYAAAWASSLLSLKRAAEEGETEMQAQAESSTGFQVEQEVVIAASPARVFQALTTEIGAWWSHAFSTSPTVRLEPRVGGRFYESFGDGEDGALYAVVTYLKHGEALRLSGPMGMAGPVTGAIAFTLAASDGGTRLSLSHQVTGPVSEETRAGYTAGWRELLDGRLRAFVERGEHYQR